MNSRDLTQDFYSLEGSMNREQVDQWCERAIIGLVMAVLVFGPLATGAVRSLEFLVIQTLTVVASLLWGVRLWLNPRHTLIWTPVCWTVLAFWAYAVCSYAMGDVEYAARRELVRVTVYALLFFIILNNVNRQEPGRWVLLALIALATGIAVYAIYQFASKSPTVWHFIKPVQYGRRAGGTYINPNHLAGFLEMILPIAISLTLLSRLGHVAKIVLGYASLVILAGICVTISRAGWMAAGASLLVLFGVLLFYRGLRAISIVMLAVMLAGGSMFILNSKTSQARLNDLKQAHPEARSYFWSAAITMWKDHPWLGVGPGHYDLRYGQYRSANWQAQMRPVYAHNDYLNTLADWGLVGMGLIVATLVFTVIGVMKTLPYVTRTQNDLEAKRSTRQAVVVGASVGLLAMMLHSIFDFNMQIPANAILAIALIALLTGYRRFATDRFWVSPRLAGRILLTAVLAAGVAFLTAEAIRKSGEYAWLRRAKISKSPQEQLVLLKQAYEKEPANYETTYRIGELLRLQSWQGDDDYKELAESAMLWFQKGMALNPYDASNFLRYGMCLDWIGRTKEAAPQFEHAVQLDPNSYYAAALYGWHFVQVENYAAAKPWLERSLKLLDNYANRNPIATTYLRIVQQKLGQDKQTRRLESVEKRAVAPDPETLRLP